MAKQVRPSRRLIDVIIKIMHEKPYLINNAICLHKEIELYLGHKIHFKTFNDTYKKILNKK